MDQEPSWAAWSEQLKAFFARDTADEAEFNRLALALFALQFERVPIYRALCISRGVTPATVANWPDIPALPTEAFKEFEVTSLAPDERTDVFYSSGTTAENRSRHFHSASSLSLYIASLRPWFARHLRPDATETRLLILTPSREVAPNSSLAYMFDSVAWTFSWAAVDIAGRVAADGSWEVDTEMVFRVLRDTATPVTLLGPAYAFVHLLDSLPVKRLALPAGSRALETGGYKGRSRELPKAALHELISRRLGLPETRIVCEYGMSELGSQAYDRVAGEAAGAFHFPPWARARIISPETGREAAEGEIGLIRVYDLANARSVLAVQTSDLAIRRGDGFELLGRAPAADARGCSLMMSAV